MVQLETIGQFGVFLILFSVGLGFAPERVRPVLRPALIASFVPALFLVVMCAAAGRWVLHASLVEGAFVGACLSLSSTPLVLNFISSERNAEADTPTSSGTGEKVLNDEERNFFAANYDVKLSEDSCKRKVIYHS